MLNALVKAWITTPFSDATKKLRIINEKFLIIDKQESRIKELQELLADLIKYPPNTQGIPLLDTEEVLLAFEPIIEETFRASGMIRGTEDSTHPCFNNTYMPVIKRIISYYHLLPASEYNHHNEVGGLISHSLEVGLMSLRLAKNKKLTPIVGGFQDTEKLRESRWQFATWLCGIMHDCGKIISDINVVNLKSNDIIWQPQFETLYEWSKNNNVHRYQVIWNNHRTVRGHDGIAPIMITSMINGIVKRWLFDPCDDLSGPLVNALSSYANKDGYIESCIRTADHLSSERDLKIQVHKLLGKRRSGIEQRLLDAIKECRVNKWRKVNTSSSRLFILHDEVYLKYPEAIEDIAKTINHYQVNAVPTTAKALLEVLEASLIVVRNHEQSDYSILSFIDNNKTNQLKVVRLNFTGIAFNIEIVPPSLTNYNLALSANGELVTADKAGNVTYTEPNKQFKTSFNYDGYIQPNKQPTAQANTQNTPSSAVAVNNQPTQSVQPAPSGPNSSNHQQPVQQVSPTPNPKSKQQPKQASQPSQPPKAGGKSKRNTPKKQNDGASNITKGLGIKFENDDSNDASQSKSRGSQSDCADTGFWNNDMGFGVANKNNQSDTADNSLPDDEKVKQAITSTPPLLVQQEDSSNTQAKQQALTINIGESEGQKPEAKAITEFKDRDCKQRQCIQLEANLLAMMFIIAKSYELKILTEDLVSSPQSQDGLYINILLLDRMIEDNLGIKFSHKYVNLSNKKNERRVKITNDLKSIGTYWRVNRHITLSLSELLGLSLNQTRNLFTPVNAFGIKTKSSPAFQDVVVRTSKETETLLLKSKIGKELNWMQDGFYVEKK